VNWRTIPYDYKMLKGDPMLILSLMVPFILWALMHYLFPFLDTLVMNQWSVDILPYYRQAGTFFLMLIPMMMGMVYGFILLDERDGGIITAISVTPTGKSGYLKLRMGIPIFLSFIFIILLAAIPASSWTHWYPGNPSTDCDLTPHIQPIPDPAACTGGLRR